MPTGAPIRVLIVDDSALVREGLRAVLGTHGKAARIEVSAEADGVAAAVREAKRVQPDVVLMDIRLPDGSGLDACRDILRQRPEARVLILTSAASDELIQQAIVAGAQGYLMKEIDPAGLIRAISDAAAGRSVLTPEITDRVLRLLREGAGPADGGMSTLSAQEYRVLELVAQGLTNKEIGDKLTLSDNTVKNYLVSVFEKLRVKRRSEAAAQFVHARQARDRRA